MKANDKPQHQVVDLLPSHYYRLYYYRADIFHPLKNERVKTLLKVVKDVSMAASAQMQPNTFYSDSGGIRVPSESFGG